MRYIVIILLLTGGLINAQSINVDTLLTLDNITVKAKKIELSDIRRLEVVSGTMIVSGRKNEVVQLASLNASMPEKIGRQVFAKVPGTFVYDMDGSGNQINISTRGLDPHRSWEYNVRQNNILVNSDLYGYPASHYSPPLESYERIELIRGTSSLQYGAQFGGMINYVTKSPDTTKTIGYEGVQSIGSYGMLSSYNSLGGKVGKLTYSAYYYRKSYKGYRENSKSEAEAQFLSLQYDVNPSFSLKAELGRSTYLYQSPGPLTDAMFAENPRQSTRSRNYFNPDIYVPSLTAYWDINPTTRLQLSTSAVLGTRNSVQFIAFADVEDNIDPVTNEYQNRQVDVDNFNSYTSEMRILKKHRLLSRTNHLSAGIQYTHNTLKRNQLGLGTTGIDYDLSLVSDFQRKVALETQNIAVFVENLIQISDQFSITPGIRFESGVTEMSGTLSYLDAEDLPENLRRSFPLLGITTEYKIAGHKLYGGISQGFRPVLFADFLPANALSRVAQDLRDANGYTAELGIRGRFKSWLHYDVSYFHIRYNDRIGNLAIQEGGESYILKSNIGNTATNGLEVFAEAFKSISRNSRISFFTSTSLMSGVYLSGTVSVSNENTSIAGNTLETVPEIISRNGLKFASGIWEASLQYSYVGESFSDAINRVEPNANGTSGLVPGYGLLDFMFGVKINENLSFNLGVNNILDKQYFTKRPAGYPGAGVWSSDGRAVMGSVRVRL